MAKIFQAAFMVLLFASLLSCVSNRKYQESETARSQALNQAATATKQKQEAETALEGIKVKVKELEADYAEIKSDYDLLQTRYDQQQRLNKDLQDSYDKLLALNEKLKDDASSGKRELKEELSRKEDELRRQEDELRRREREMEDLAKKLRTEREEIDQLKKDLEGKNENIGSLEDYKKKLEGDLAAREKKMKELQADLDAREKKMKELQADLAAREKRVKELENAIATRDAKAQALKDKLAAALTGFTSSDLSVEQRNGKVYVSMSQNLLFATGSSKVASKGVGALKNLADVLNKSKDIDIMVEGHTDSDGDAKMNWELSSKRSLSVSDILISNSVAPERITAAGRGEHVPIASNDTEEGKAKNRRTEIILSPKLDEIFDILKN